MKILSLTLIVSFFTLFEVEVNAQSVSTSNDWSIVLCSDGTVQAFGRNDHGQLGNGTFMESNVPVPVSNLTNIVAVSAGLDHALALTAEGKIWGWGDNVNGQLGNGSFVDLTTPVEIDSLENVIAISTGANHSMAITDDGKMWVWGANHKGQLAVPDINNSPIPLEVIGLSNVTKISGAANHCIASTADGQAWTWGHNNNGQLGNGTNDDTHVPQLLDIPSFIIDVGAGNGFIYCLTESGEIWTSGSNSRGQLGNGTGVNTNTPAAIAINDVKYVAQGSMASLCMVMKHDNTAWAWGSNWYGSYGNGQIGDQLAPVAIPNFDGAHEIAIGKEHSLALFSDETLDVAGLNGWGQLGNGTFANAEIAVENELVCSGYVSVKEQSLGDLLLYPNPNGGCFSIQHDHAFEKVEIFDSMGRTVFERSLAPAYLVEISTELPAGIYLIHVRAEDFVLCKQVVIK
jgi:alpha-tubulin suppressor-like RCC1 family protein